MRLESGSRVRILFLCHRVPYPPNRGDRIATHRRLLHLASRHEVTCLTFAMEGGDADSIRVLESQGVRVVADRFDEKSRKLAALPALLGRTPLTIACFRSRKLLAAAQAAASSIDLVVAYSGCMAQFVERVRAPRVMEFGDLDSEKWRQYASESSGISGWIYGREARTLLAYETHVARNFEVSLVVSAAEAATFRERTGVTPLVVGNGVDLERFSPGPREARVPGLIVFTGIMDYRPNVDGCVRFAREVLPLVRKRVPTAQFRIVGARPSAEIWALKSLGAEVTGAVPETADHLRQASVAVAPLRLGRGLQNKVLEAMACATPMVVSPNASAGVDAQAGEHYLLADSAEETAERVVELLTDPARAAAIGDKARTRMEERYPWSRAMADYDAALEEAVRRFATR